MKQLLAVLLLFPAVLSAIENHSLSPRIRDSIMQKPTLVPHETCGSPMACSIVAAIASCDCRLDTLANRVFATTTLRLLGTIYYFQGPFASIAKRARDRSVVDAFPARPLNVSVNLSTRQFRRDDLCDAVVECLDRSGIPAGDLGVEITEGTIMENADKATEILSELRKLGVRWSIDDFGTGYSSLSYLNRFPVDILKIDQSFVRHLGPHGENTEIIRTIMSLASSLRMRVVAEGIETAEQLAQLRTYGCQFGQGYYFSHPLDQESATRLLQEK